MTQSSSLHDSLSAEAIIAQLVMRQNSCTHDVWMLVEGKTDAAFIAKFKTDNCGLIIVGNKPNLLKCVNYFFDSSTIKIKQSVVGIVDADFDRLLKIIHCENIFMTDGYDLLVDAFSSTSFNGVVTLYDVPSEKINQIRDEIFSACYETGVLRYICMRDNIPLCFKSCDTLLGKSSDELIDGLILRQKSENIDSIKLKEVWSKEMYAQHPREQICRGHDLIHYFSFLMKNNETPNRASAVAHNKDKIINGYDSIDFSQTKLFESISIWSKKTNIKLLRMIS